MGTAGRMLRETSPYGWLILLLLVGGLVGVGVQFAVSRKRARTPAWTSWAAPVLLALVAGGGYARAALDLSRRFGDAGADTRLGHIRVLAAGTSASLGVPQLAASAGALLLATTSLLLAFGSLRPSSRPRRDALPFITGGAGALLSIAALYMRHEALAMLGMLVWSDRIFSPVVLPSLSLAISALVIAAALGGGGGDAVGHPDETARDRAASAVAISSLAAALGAVVLTLVAIQLGEWRTIFGAMSGETVDAAVREEIFEVGAKEAHALFGGALVSLFPALLTLAIATLPRVRTLVRGLKPAFPALVLFAVTLAIFLALPALAVPTARRAMLRAEAFTWPPSVNAIAVSLEHDQSVDFDGRVLAVFDDRCDPTSIDLPQGTDALHPDAPPPPVAIAADRNVTAQTLHRWAAEVRKRRADGELRPVVAWLVRSTEHLVGGDGKSGTFDVAVPMAVTATLGPLARQSVHLHVTNAGWKFRSGTTVKEGTEEAPPIDRFDERTVLLTADEDVPAQRLFDVIAVSHSTHILLGPAVSDAVEMTAPEDATPASAPAADGSTIVKKQSTGFLPAEQTAIEASLRRAAAICPSPKRNGAPVDVRFHVLPSGALKTEVASKDRRRATCIQNAFSKNVHVDARRPGTIAYRVEPPR